MEGWIKLHRKMVGWEWYNDNNTKILFLHLLLTANHKDKKWQGQIIKRGQKITSLQHLADETHLTVRQVRTSLNKLKSTNELTIKTTSKNTLITIEKYSDYQDRDEEDDNQNDKQDDKQMTNKRQTNDKQMTTNKNDKNIKNDKNEKNNKKEIKKEKIHFAEFVSMTNAEYDKLVSTYGKEFADQCIIVLDNYKGASGKKYQSDYRAILTWVIGEVKSKQSKKQSGNPFLEFAREEGII